MYRKQLIYEQTEQLEPLTAQEKEETKDLNDRQTQIYFRNKNIRVKKQGGKWYKVIGGSTPPTPPPQPTTSLSKYVGEYYGEEILPNFQIKEKNGKLLIPLTLGSVELIYVSDNQFSGETLGVDYTFDFRERDGAVTGGVMKIKGRTANFTKKGSLPSPQPPSSDDFEWKEIAKDAYDELVSASKWVKKQAGKFWAYMNSTGEVATDKGVWSCIENYLDLYQYHPLAEPFGPLKEKFRTWSWDYKYKGNATMARVYFDKQIEVLDEDTQEVIPSHKGTWECLSEDSFQITWNDGKVWKFNQRTPIITTTDPNQTATTLKLKKMSEACPRTKPCPSIKEVLENGKSLSLCMKCDAIEILQDTEQFKLIYFDVLKAIGEPEAIDDVFSPAMEEAVKRFQKTNIGRDYKPGIIDKETFQYMWGEVGK